LQPAVLIPLLPALPKCWQRRGVGEAYASSGTYGETIASRCVFRKRFVEDTLFSARFFGEAFVSSERRRWPEMAVISSTAAKKAASLAFDGLLKPLIFLTNCSEAARISCSVTGGSKLKRVLIFLHISLKDPYFVISIRLWSGSRDEHS
jgi:hypothetical protein